MNDFEVMREALNNLFKLLETLKCNDKQKAIIMRKLFNLSASIKDIKEVFDLFKD